MRISHKKIVFSKQFFLMSCPCENYTRMCVLGATLPVLLSSTNGRPFCFDMELVSFSMALLQPGCVQALLECEVVICCIFVLILPNSSVKRERIEFPFQLNGTFRWELLPNDFLLVVLQTISIISFHLWCILGGSV